MRRGAAVAASVVAIVVFVTVVLLVALARGRGRSAGPGQLERPTRAERLEPLRAFKAEILGRKGEAVVAQEIERLGLPALHNIVLIDERGATQIDHVVRTASGIVVLETKRFSGMVTGGVGDREWQHKVGGGEKVVFPRGRRWRRPRRVAREAVVTRFQNPLRQNYRHVRAVQFVIGDAAVPVRGHVVSAGLAEFQGELGIVVQRADTLAEILTDRQGTVVLSAALDRAWAALTRAARSGEGWRPEGKESQSGVRARL
jgi:Nuclease-related domain